MIDFYSKDKLLLWGVIDRQFKAWLACNFSYYTQGLLVDSSWDSTVVYQYDPETDKLRSTLNEISFNNLNQWRLYKDDNEEFYLSFYWNDIFSHSYIMSWLVYEKPNYVNFEYISVK